MGILVPTDREVLLAAGREALEVGAWATAEESFRAAVDLDESADALMGLADALWWLGKTNEAIFQRERAFAAFLRETNPTSAASAALWLCIDYRQQVGNAAASAGWLARFARLVEEFELGPLRGWLLVIQALASDDPVADEDWARQAHQHARASGDLDLELCAASQVGSALVRQGRVPEGVTWLDESMAGSLSGEGAAPDTVVWTSCNMIVSCARGAQFERAVQWVRAAEAFTRRYGCPYLYSECRTSYGGVLAAVGDWPQAERELQAAIELSRDAIPVHHRRALATLAELRVAQGRIEEAECLVAGLEDSEAATPVWARIHLMRGRPALAAATLRRRLAHLGEGQLDSALLLELLGEAEIEQGERQSAAERGQRLDALGNSSGCLIAAARGRRLWGRALAASGLAAEAAGHLEAALTTFVGLEMPFEVARTRMLYARTLAGRAPDLAVAETQLALGTFEDLGAGGDADAAAAFLRQLGVSASRSGPRGVGPLTKREDEVLSLLAEGLSNPEIADRLYLSRKTVEHHVARVLAKLGVRNRAEATAAAIRRVQDRATA
jgi:DNA-binding CsgD family transcriptional regulator/thioredoxin-like negative regulator of GroEL